MIYVGKIKIKFAIEFKKYPSHYRVSQKRNLYECSLLLSDGDDPNETFSVQYAKSNRSGCHGCDAFIDKDTLRLSRKNYTSRRARRYGPTDEWYHVDCFNQLKKDLGFFGTAESFVFFL